MDMAEKKHPAKHPGRELLFDTAGMSFRLTADKKDELSEEAPLKIKLVRDPANSQDHNAIAIHLTEYNPGLHIGYVPRQIAAKLAPMLDEGKIRVVEAWMTEMGEFNGRIRIIFHKKFSSGA